MEDLWISILFIAVGAIAVFLVIREVILWYFKINRMSEQLESIDEHLYNISVMLSQQLNQPQQPTVVEYPDKEIKHA